MRVNRLTNIERLDLVARAEAIRSFLSRARFPLMLVSMFCVLLAFISESSFYETVAVRILATCLVATTTMVWLNSRYAPYALAILFFGLLTGSLFPFFDDPDNHTLLGSTTRYALSGMFLFAGYRWWTNSALFASGQSKAFDEERSKVFEWTRVLKSQENTGQVVAFSTRNFWSGHWTYRLLNAEFCWVVAKFKIENLGRLADLRVRELGARGCPS